MHLFNIRQVFVLRMFAWVSLSFSSRNPPLIHQYGLIPICACLVINEGDSLAFAAKQHPFSREGEENGQEHPHLIKQKLSVCHFSHVYPNYVYVCVWYVAEVGQIMAWLTFGGQRTTLWCWFSPPTFLQVLGLKPIPLGLYIKYFYPLGHQPASNNCF